MSEEDPKPARRPRRGHGRPTLHDVAAHAGVTRVAISRFLRSGGSVSAETAERIRAAIAKTGYAPNLQAGQLASGQSKIVAALIPSVAHSLFGETIQGLTQGLEGSGYELLLAVTHYSLEREESQLRAVCGWAPAAVIVTGSRHTDASSAMLARLHAGGASVIEVWEHGGRRVKSHPFAQIGIDHAQVGRTMARHLMAFGHRRLVYVDSGVQEDYRAHARGDAFVREATRHGCHAQRVVAGTGNPFEAGEQVLRLLWTQAAPRCTAIAFANDHLACGALLAAQALGVHVPKQLNLLGFGDFPLASHLKPALSTVATPREEVGRAAAVAVLEALRTGVPARDQLLSCEILIRQSTG